jgi:hypothetical protein
MAWRKLSAAEIETFDAALPADPRVVRAKMFGLPHGKVGDHMFAGRHPTGVTVRVSPTDRDDLLRKGAKLFEPMPGRVMKEWVLLPEALVENAKVLAGTIDRAFQYTASLPRKRKAKKSAKAGPKPRSPKKAR